jgi:hypothetical protein
MLRGRDTPLDTLERRIVFILTPRILEFAAECGLKEEITGVE